ncbi:hypothetical protein ColTof4_01322 [Colletotrichum tofieldiae]|nr:hypothetical protein ColTof3_08574 [Colletotrichum tofieldiae]GKT68899.1 hypothetical protein ColTof4_01322 [Colletotrichum tofieldiae]
MQDFDRTILCDDNTFSKKDTVRHLFNNNMDAANFDDPLYDVFRYGNKKGIALQNLKLVVHKAPTNPWLVGHETDCLVQIAERGVVEDLERWCKDAMCRDGLMPIAQPREISPGPM